MSGTGSEGAEAPPADIIFATLWGERGPGVEAVEQQVAAAAAAAVAVGLPGPGADISRPSWHS